MHVVVFLRPLMAIMYVGGGTGGVDVIGVVRGCHTCCVMFWLGSVTVVLFLVDGMCLFNSVLGVAPGLVSFRVAVRRGVFVCVAGSPKTVLVRVRVRVRAGLGSAIAL